MKNLFILSIFIFAGACSLNKSSTYWNEDPIKKKNEDNEVSKIMNKSDDITLMSLKEYKLYIKNYTEKNNYPKLNNERFN